MNTTEIGAAPPRLDHVFFDKETRPHLGAVLLKSKLLQPEQLDAALAEQEQQHKRLGEILIERGWLFPQDIARALATQDGLGRQAAKRRLTSGVATRPSAPIAAAAAAATDRVPDGAGPLTDVRRWCLGRRAAGRARDAVATCRKERAFLRGALARAVEPA